MNFDFKPQKMSAKAIVGAIVVSFVLGSLILALSGHNPLDVYGTMIDGSLMSRFSLASTIRWTTPLLFTGLAAAVALRGGMFNIGTEGQMFMGAFFSAWAGFTFHGLPPAVHIGLCLIAGAFGGALWALFPAVIRAYFGASEMVMTLMLNYVATNLTDYLTRYHFLATGVQGHSLITAEIAPEARFAKIWADGSAHYGVVLGLICIALFWFMVHKTKFGYELHICGVNPDFAKCGGVNVPATRIRIMLLSGAIAGLAGATEVMGVVGRFMSGFSPDFGMDGMVVALMGNSTPIGVLLGAFFLGIVKAGALQVERVTDVSRSLAMVLQGLMVTFISCTYLANMAFKHPKHKADTGAEGGT